METTDPLIFWGTFSVALYVHSNSSTLFKKKKLKINLICFFVCLFALFENVFRNIGKTTLHFKIIIEKRD